MTCKNLLPSIKSTANISVLIHQHGMPFVVFSLRFFNEL